jgi:hypothetical protein
MQLIACERYRFNTRGPLWRWFFCHAVSNCKWRRSASCLEHATMLAGFACFAAMRKTEAGSGPAGPSLTGLRSHHGFTAYNLSSP